MVKKEVAEASANTNRPEFIRVKGEIFVQSHEDVVTNEQQDLVRDLVGKKKFSKVLDEMQALNRGVGGEGILAKII